MKKTVYDIKFSIDERIKLPESVHKELYGVVIGIWIDRGGISYKIRYFWESKPQEVYFLENELESYKE
jgi:hypothetical protein